MSNYKKKNHTFIFNLKKIMSVIPATLQRIKRRTYNVQMMDGWIMSVIEKYFPKGMV